MSRLASSRFRYFYFNFWSFCWIVGFHALNILWTARSELGGFTHICSYIRCTSSLHHTPLLFRLYGMTAYFLTCLSCTHPALKIFTSDIPDHLGTFLFSNFLRW